MSSIGIGIGCTDTSPLQITTFASSTQTCTFWCIMALAVQNYSIYCRYVIVASDFNAISDVRIQKYIENLGSSPDVISQLRSVTFNYKNENKYGRNIREGLIAQEVTEILPWIVNIS